MKELSFLTYFLLLGIVFVPSLFYAQEEQEIRVEESAEVFLEDYSDEFQENFFEGLKQKGIQNYDKAINYLLECKRLEPNNVVVAHELAKTYFLDKKYIQSQKYAMEAVSSDPENYWYLNTLITNTADQGISTDSFKDRIPWDNEILQKNLATIYFKNGKLEEALKTLKNLGNKDSNKHLAQKITDSIAKREAEKEGNLSPVVTNEENTVATNDLEEYKSKISSLLLTGDMSSLLSITEEALENYPSQPFFYYANGYSLNKLGDYKDAVEVLETALDYLIDDVALANKIYKELSDAYNALDNPSKANMYFSKIKPGF
jgi:tetratricopeptide (TPR) repeat protein